MLVHVRMSENMRGFVKGQTYRLDLTQAKSWQEKGWCRIEGKASGEPDAPSEQTEAKVRSAPVAKVRKAPKSAKGE